ncbi:MAG: M28 family peptidase [Pseudomonadota bacterium]
MNDTETTILDHVEMDEPWGLVESFATFKREHPTDVNRGMDEVATRLSRHGVPVKVHEPSLYLSLPGTARVQAGGTTYRAKPPAFAAIARDGVSAPLVYLGANAADDIDDIFDLRIDGASGMADKARGAIVISEGFASPVMVRQFEDLGAVGVIAVNPGVDIHWGICTTIWGIPDLDDLPRKPGIPALAVNKPDGQALIEMAKRGDSATIFTELEEGWFDNKLVEVTIPGAIEPDKYVLLHGHLDSWDVGVGDNAVGDACMLEVARTLWANRDKLRRTVKICWWPGHSTGRYAGSTWYADTFALDLDENCVAQVNCDSPGCRWATEFINLSRMSETDDLIAGAIEEIAGKTAEGERPHRAGDYSFNNIGLSSYFMLSSTMPNALREEKGYYPVGGCGANIAWHTENDTIDIADKGHLERDIKIYLLAVLRTANAAILPFDWRATAREFQDTIAAYQGAAGDRFDLSLSSEATTVLLDALEAFYAAVESGQVPEDKANTVIQDLARILVPINFCREARFRHDPAAAVPALPTIFTATELDQHSDTLGFAQNQLLRGQNRLVSALRQATRHIALVTA